MSLKSRNETCKLKWQIKKPTLLYCGSGSTGDFFYVKMWIFTQFLWSVCLFRELLCILKSSVTHALCYIGFLQGVFDGHGVPLGIAVWPEGYKLSRLGPFFDQEIIYRNQLLTNFIIITSTFFMIRYIINHTGV